MLFLRLRSARANVSVDLKWHVVRAARGDDGCAQMAVTRWRRGERVETNQTRPVAYGSGGSPSARSSRVDNHADLAGSLC